MVKLNRIPKEEGLECDICELSINIFDRWGQVRLQSRVAVEKTVDADKINLEYKHLSLGY